MTQWRKTFTPISAAVLWSHSQSCSGGLDLRKYARAKRVDRVREVILLRLKTYPQNKVDTQDCYAREFDFCRCHSGQFLVGTLHEDPDSSAKFVKTLAALKLGFSRYAREGHPCDPARQAISWQFPGRVLAIRNSPR